MIAITPRIPKVDWSKGFTRHWNGGNPAVTHAFNAMSFLFPQGEKFFIEVARDVAKQQGELDNTQLEAEVRPLLHRNQFTPGSTNITMLC